ncbi:VWA domain-containing protein [Hazenella sp. IB182353]|uniref:vWA domain-containing protein n=1 Tax=Polycladospora coralii TaxID=2771432 RepID=UPI0017472427|nr:VWA domain-containing protein [Polycladospora coralii]MBS7531749.1 VWA domain-containing protein [Polycladospora coralii]
MDIKRFYPIGLSLFLIITACSQTTSVLPKQSISKEKDEKSQEKPATDVEGIFQEGPGDFAGTAYDEKKLKAELNNFPKHLNNEEVYERLIPLLAEDYQSLVKKIEEFDTSLTLKKAPTDGNIDEPQMKEETTRVSILLDASGSMAGKVGSQTKMTVAKNAISRFASTLPEEAQVSVRTYGQGGSNQEKDKQKSCESTEQIYPFANYDQAKLEQSLENVKPTGWTPIASAIEAVQSDFDASGDSNENIVYIVSDGIETCGGDPVAVAKQLHESNIKAMVNIIGFDVDENGDNALKKVAAAGGGEFVTADSAEDLRKYFDKKNQELWWNWDRWGTQAWLELDKQYMTKVSKVEDIAGYGSGDLYKLAELENKRFNFAIKYLEKKEMITFEVRRELQNKLNWRQSEVRSYVDEKRDELRNALDQNKEQLEEVAKERENEMKDKYNKD